MKTKDKILALLEKHRGEPLSGNEIAESLGISRTAVWKAVKSLREEGYTVSAASNRGYTFENQNDMLSPQSIYPYVADREFYPEIHVIKITDSTNNDAKKHGAQGGRSGSVWIAEEQTAGKGRMGKQFHSPPGSGIYMSVLFRLNVDIADSLLITSAVAVAVCRAVQKVCGVSSQIKWVNDVYIEGKKLCGILTEASLNYETQMLDYVVTGIGINMKTSAFPEDLKEIVTSISEHTTANVSRSQLIGEVLNQLQLIQADLTTKGFLSEYKARSCILGEKINVITPSESFPATAIDINDFGHLIVEYENGKTKALNSGEISIRKR